LKIYSIRSKSCQWWFYRSTNAFLPPKLLQLATFVCMALVYWWLWRFYVFTICTHPPPLFPAFSSYTLQYWQITNTGMHQNCTQNRHRNTSNHWYDPYINWTRYWYTSVWLWCYSLTFGLTLILIFFSLISPFFDLCLPSQSITQETL
jgi:hypothetical protein